MPLSHDLGSKLGYRLMQARLGVYDKYKSNQILDSKLDGIQNQNIRLSHQGGSLQQDRMIADKRRSLNRALYYSYQGADIKKVTKDNEADIVRALINPNKLKQDYDDKIVSIFYDYNFNPGDVFEWIGTGTHWLIYLQDLTELAYFRGDIRKCSHEISWQDENGEIHRTYAAIRGPVETKIDYIQKSGISVDNPNYSLNILLPKTEASLAYFKRYNKFYLSNDPLKVCWRIEGVDWISTPGIIEISAVEYYANEIEDDVENGVVGALIAEPVSPNSEAVEMTIRGESFIKPKRFYTYEFNGNLNSSWSVGKDIPVLLEQDGKTVKVKWLDTYSGQFDLFYGDSYRKTIVVESLF